MKFITLTIVDASWTDDCKELLIKSAEKRIYINVDHIASISVEPVHAREGYMIKDLYYVKTTIPVGRGTNGVDYRGYYVTQTTYVELITKLEIL